MGATVGVPAVAGIASSVRRLPWSFRRPSTTAHSPRGLWWRSRERWRLTGRTTPYGDRRLPCPHLVRLFALSPLCRHASFPLRHDDWRRTHISFCVVVSSGPVARDVGSDGRLEPHHWSQEQCCLLRCRFFGRSARIVARIHRPLSSSRLRSTGHWIFLETSSGSYSNARLVSSSHALSVWAALGVHDHLIFLGDVITSCFCILRHVGLDRGCAWTNSWRISQIFCVKMDLGSRGPCRLVAVV